ncbi:hypothetical protein ABZ593_21095 [Streptomyces sp. NPDC012617]|uniref:hypothetical protein n=1 Tax=Streptomyces TaxID=1883 RepID=UPI0033DBB617
MTDSTESAQARDTEAVLADMDALLAEVDKGPQAPAKPEAPTVPEDDTATEWEKVTAPRPPRQRTKVIPRQDNRYGYGTDDITLDPAAELAGPAAQAPDASADDKATPPPAASAKVTVVKDEEDQEQKAAEGDAAEPTPPSPPAQLIATTVREWRLPAGPRGKAWYRAIVHNGTGILAAFLTGCTHKVYEALNILSINGDAVAGISLAAALAALMISRSKTTFIILGAALVVVLFLQYLTVPVAVGGLASVIAWGLDQRARTMRPVTAWAVRTVFTTVALATFALVWTRVVHILTGASQ